MSGRRGERRYLEGGAPLVPRRHLFGSPAAERYPLGSTTPAIVSRTQLLVLLCISANVAGAQAGRGCAAYDHATQWPTTFGSASGADEVPSRSRIAELLEGAYTLDLVTTEGVASPVITRWEFVLVRADTMAGLSEASQRRLNQVLAGTRTDVPAPTPLDALKRGRFMRDSDIQMWVEPSSGNLRWRTAPGVLDGGLFFDVSTIDTVGFQGRWVDGGIAVSLFRRGSLEVAEVARGYYCAWKRR